MIGTALAYTLAYRLAGSSYRGGFNQGGQGSQNIYGGTSIAWVGANGYRFGGTFFEYGAGWHSGFGSHLRLIRATIASGTSAGSFNSFAFCSGTDVLAYSTFSSVYSPSATLVVDWTLFMGTIRPFSWDDWSALASEFIMISALRPPSGGCGFASFTCASLYDAFNTTRNFMATKVSETVLLNTATTIFRGTCPYSGFNLGMIRLYARTAKNDVMAMENMVFEHTRYWEQEQLRGTYEFGNMDMITIENGDIWAGTYYWLVEGVVDNVDWNATVYPLGTIDPADRR